VPQLTDEAVAAALAAAGLGGRLSAVRVVERTGSTSTDLLAAAAAGASDRTVLVADHQAAGRGRAGRTWETPPGTALTVSVLLRPAVPAHALGWLALVGGVAVVRALAGVGVEALVKWPNDVLLPGVGEQDVPGWGRDRKVAGVLGDVVPGGPGEPPAAVLGIGVNVGQGPGDLPVPSATSLAAYGVAVDRADLLARVLVALCDLDDAWRATGGDAVAADIAAECAAVCATLGSPVRVLRPGGEVLEGEAISLGEDGALRVVDASGRVHAVLAGDVERLRS
jgi:BirA family biotin operon repressor/biotin-[acetyl-CoA-carboxylase] ligase